MQKEINTVALEKYIKKCAKESAKAEHTPNDIRYEYRIVDEYLLLACKSRYQKTQRRFMYRLLHNLPDNFGLYLNVVLPAPERMGDAYRIDAPFYIYRGVDPNNSVLEWKIFDEPYTIRAKTGNCEQGGITHLERLKKYGYDYQNGCHNDWHLFAAAYEQAYGITPFEGYEQIKDTFR